MGTVKEPKTLTPDELYAMNLRMFRELEVAADAMRKMYDSVGNKLREVEERKNEKFWNEDDRKMYKRFASELRGLFDSYNEFPDKMHKLEQFVYETKVGFRDRAAEQWKRVEKFLSMTNPDNLYRDVVTHDAIHSAFTGWDNPDAQEASLFNETRLYDALGKDDARTVLALWSRFQELRVMRRRIDHEDDKYTPQIDPSEVMFRFAESKLFQKMEDLLIWTKSHLPKTVVNPEKADKHAEAQHKNLQRQVEELCARLKRVAPKKKEAA